MYCIITVCLLLFVPSFVASEERLANFKEDPSFFFGLATAPAQTEDQLDDMWLHFAEDGHVPEWSDYKHPEERIKFWYVRLSTLSLSFYVLQKNSSTGLIRIRTLISQQKLV